MRDDTSKDSEQDKLIRENSERISANAEAIRRQTKALEMIRDHYYPPEASLWRRSFGFILKVLCVVLAYAGGVQAVDWYLNVRKASSIAGECAEVARKLFFEQGDAAGALRFYEKAAELDEGEVKYRIGAAFVKNMAAVAGLFDLGRPLTDDEREAVDAALAEATFLRTSEPDDPMPHVLSAQAYTLRGEREEALAAVVRALQLAPGRAPIQVSACAIRFMNGDIQGARAALAEAERLDASLMLIPHWKGFFALVVDHDLAAAKAHFTEVTRRAPRIGLGYAMLGRTLLATKGKPPEEVVVEARAAFEKALVFNPKQQLAIQGMAELYERSGNLTLARIWLDRALAVSANDLRALIARARVAEKEGDISTSIADLTSAIALSPFRADLRRLRAEAYEKSGDTAHAAADRRDARSL